MQSLILPIIFPIIFLVTSPQCLSSTKQSLSTILTIPLTNFNLNPNPTSPIEYLQKLSTSSRIKAKTLKNPKREIVTGLSPHSYGGYSISLGFGTPKQSMPLLMDTGSDLVWFPCTHRYTCRNCTFQNDLKIHTFLPKLSLSSKILSCSTPKCHLIHPSNLQSSCSYCHYSNCTQICPPYILMYGSESTGGILISETLRIGPNRVFDFVAGCSIFSIRQPTGIAGFGRGPGSLPSQLGVRKFSYCMMSRRYDERGDSTPLVLDTAWDSSDKGSGFNYTRLLRNEIFPSYYYVGLKKITVAGKSLRITRRDVAVGSVGHGGTIVDSRTTFSYMTREVFDRVEDAFVRRVGNYSRASGIEGLTGLRPCFDVGSETVSFPEMGFHFKNGAEMKLPVENYVASLGNGVVCLTIVTDGLFEKPSGPSVILGSFQLQNFQLEYDLRNERLGFKHKKCK